MSVLRAHLPEGLPVLLPEVLPDRVLPALPHQGVPVARAMVLVLLRAGLLAATPYFAVPMERGNVGMKIRSVRRVVVVAEEDQVRIMLHPHKRAACEAVPRAAAVRVPLRPATRVPPTVVRPESGRAGTTRRTARWLRASMHLPHRAPRFLPESGMHFGKAWQTPVISLQVSSPLEQTPRHKLCMDRSPVPNLRWPIAVKHVVLQARRILLVPLLPDLPAERTKRSVAQAGNGSAGTRVRSVRRCVMRVRPPRQLLGAGVVRRVVRVEQIHTAARVAIGHVGMRMRTGSRLPQQANPPAVLSTSARLPDASPTRRIPRGGLTALQSDGMTQRSIFPMVCSVRFLVVRLCFGQYPETPARHRLDNRGTMYSFVVCPVAVTAIVIAI